MIKPDCIFSASNKLTDLLLRAKERGKDRYKWSWNDVKCIRAAESSLLNETMDFERERKHRKDNFERSGILPLHQGCTLDNYVVQHLGQEEVLLFARNYIEHFLSNNGQGFFFAGDTGTGKNHIAAAICNELMNCNHSCLIITVSELMMMLRGCYGKNPDMKEAVFIKKIIKFDLLVIDEIGLQRNTDSEKLILNHIIDSRVCRLKPTGILTNKGSEDIENILGVRIMRRMDTSNSKWISFNWIGYRK